MLVGCCQLAEKRKTLVDEMSIRGQETAGEQKKKMEEVQESLKVGRVSCDQLSSCIACVSAAFFFRHT